MKTLSEFTDSRHVDANGKRTKRYGPGDEDKIDPALDPAEIERLKKAGVIDPDGTPDAKGEPRSKLVDAASPQAPRGAAPPPSPKIDVGVDPKAKR